MKTLWYNTLVVCITAFLCVQCDKNDEPKDQLPPITQIGANTFGCLINGKVFVTKDPTGYYPPGGGPPEGLTVTVGENRPDYEYFGIDATNGDDTYMYVYIPKEKPEKTSYPVLASPGVRASMEKPNFAHFVISINNQKYLSVKNSGNIVFTKADSISSIYAGTFSGSLKQQNNPNDIIQITNGRFDINLNTLNN